ncbi:GHKL domain-containing protein [Lactobacillus reuteri]|uniref:Histidine kinase n=2 Tax=Limosilactobacillus caviae TaxID=1769424 RepID=A0ABQ2C469_9LACO|nr:GHKL domain-containing protein [Limosilactobacillus reuteri]GGI62233.1 histidine kinase [Limosilactobacillus caviae]
MIHLTFFQSVIADFLNIAEIIIIYRFLTNSFTIKIMVVDFLVSLFITSIPTLIASLYILFVVIYLWLFDRIGAHTYIVLNNIFAMFVGVIMSSLFDLVDHYTYALFLQGKSNIFILGWLIPFNDLLVTIIFGIIVIKLIRPRLTWFIVNFPRPVRLWKITSIYFLLYIWLTVVAEKDGIANEYAPLMLIMYLIIIFVGGIGFVSFIRSNAKAQRQQQLINSYRNQIETAQKVNAQYEDFRRERHDMKNMLLSVQGYIRDHNDEKANQLLSAFLQTNIDGKNYEGIDKSLSRLNISGLRNLIKEKAYRIVEQEIPLAIEVNAKIDSLPGSEVKTARIIGILLDNAIEATSNQKRPYIQIALLRHDEENYELVVANSLEKTLDLNKAMKFEHSEKENHQGIGLSNITQLVDNDDRYSFSAEVKEKVIIMTCFIQGK